jgi:hypothetical protein
MGSVLDVIPEAEAAHQSLPNKVSPSHGDQRAVTRFLADAIEMAKLPAPWVKICGPDGEHFFTNQATGFSTWSHPLEPSLCELASACRDYLWLPAEERVASISALQLQWQKNARDVIMMWYRVEKPDSPDYFYNLKTGETMWEDPVVALLPGTYVKCKSLELLQNEGYVALLLGECKPPPGYRLPGETEWARKMARRVLRMGCIDLNDEAAACPSPWDLPLRLDEQERNWAKAERESCCCQSVRSTPSSAMSTDVGSSDCGEFSDEEACPDSPASFSSSTPMFEDLTLLFPSRQGAGGKAAKRNIGCHSGRTSLGGSQSRCFPASCGNLSDGDDASPASPGSVASVASLHIDIADESEIEYDDGALDLSAIP